MLDAAAGTDLDSGAHEGADAGERDVGVDAGQDAGEPDAGLDAADASASDASHLDAATGGPPPKPKELISYLTGSPNDWVGSPQGPGLILMGGGTDVDAAFAWWKPRIAGGDVVVLRTSGADGYNDYLYRQIGGCDSVETLLVTSRTLANDPYVAWAVSHAEGIFLAGGDQATYVAAWKGTALSAALTAAWSRGAVVGGTSAGCVVLGEFLFAATLGSVYSAEALADPYDRYVTLDRAFLTFPPLAGVIADSHFAQRDRMGRLVAFVARLEADGWGDPVLGLGVDEATALVVDAAGLGAVVGSGAVYAVKSNGQPQQCVAGKPLQYGPLTTYKLAAGATIDLPSGATTATPRPVSAQDGGLSPANPY